MNVGIEMILSLIKKKRFLSPMLDGGLRLKNIDVVALSLHLMNKNSLTSNNVSMT